MTVCMDQGQYLSLCIALNSQAKAANLGFVCMHACHNIMVACAKLKFTSKFSTKIW